MSLNWKKFERLTKKINLRRKHNKECDMAIRETVGILMATRVQSLKEFFWQAFVKSSHNWKQICEGCIFRIWGLNLNYFEKHKELNSRKNRGYNIAYIHEMLIYFRIIVKWKECTETELHISCFQRGFSEENEVYSLNSTHISWSYYKHYLHKIVQFNLNESWYNRAEETQNSSAAVCMHNNLL